MAEDKRSKEEDFEAKDQAEDITEEEVTEEAIAEEEAAAEVENEAAAKEAEREPEKESPKSDKASTKSDKKKDDKFGEDGKIHSGLFDKKKKKTDPMKEKVAELEDKVKRQMAEFENFRKRTDKEKTAMFDMGARTVVEKILPVIDNFERGLDGAPDDAFAEGMQMIYKQMKTALYDLGVTEIEAMGCEFDPNLHNAVMHVDDDSYGENEIVEVLQKGYIYHDMVVRHSMVKVAN